MARAALQIVGMAIGGLIGGPIGASIGGSIGSAIGATFEPTTQVEGPRLSDLRVISSAYGVDIPLVYGPQNRLSGNLVWSTGLIEKKKINTPRNGYVEYERTQYSKKQMAEKIGTDGLETKMVEIYTA